MRHFLRNHGLSVAMLGFFVLSFVGQIVSGRAQHNEERARRGQPALGYAGYLRSPHFGEATAENWESEFLQMFVFVLATAFLYEKGSAESKDPRKRHAHTCSSQVQANSPWPARRGGWVLRIYEHSLSLGLFVLFAIAFNWHVHAGLRRYNEELQLDGKALLSAPGYLRSSRFWFESFQNWQSEFLSIGAMVLLSIWLREANSPESKEVATPHGENEE